MLTPSAQKRKAEMEVLRVSKIPTIYTSIPWIRKAGEAVWADCVEDIELIKQMKNVCSRKLCLSSFDSLAQFIIKAVFPDNWNEYNGTSEELINWNYYHWKVWDVLYLIDGNTPNEAVSLKTANIPFNYLETIENKQSCIPLLRELKKKVKYDDLTEDKIHKIERIEEELFTELSIRKLKGSSSGYVSEYKKCIKSKEQQVNGKLRQEILRRDNYKCIFCGSTAETTKLEVDHIIPRLLIKKMFLNNSLNTEPINLCTTCRSCNREKSDQLNPKDIDYYLIRFSDHSHPNYGIIPYLLKIKELQNKET